jgi:hypothetical protein
MPSKHPHLGQVLLVELLVRVVGVCGALQYARALLQAGCSLLPVALVLEQNAQVAVGGRYKGMLLSAVYLHQDGEGIGEEFLGLLYLAQVLARVSGVVQRECHFGMDIAQLILLDDQCPFIVVFGLMVVFHFEIHVPEVLQRRRNFQVSGS